MEPAVGGCLPSKLWSSATVTVTAGLWSLRGEQSETCSNTLFKTGPDQRLCFINFRDLHVASGTEALWLLGSLRKVKYFTRQNTGLESWTHESPITWTERIWHHWIHFIPAADSDDRIVKACCILTDYSLSLVGYSVDTHVKYLW